LRIVLDTCVLKLATLPNPANPAAFIWELCRQGKLQFFGSPDTLSEYHCVLAEHPLFLEEIQTAIELCYPFFTATAIEHEPDNRFLEVALAVQADYLIPVTV
jgi:predicted nucleic acid-binding protein